MTHLFSCAPRPIIRYLLCIVLQGVIMLSYGQTVKVDSAIEKIMKKFEAVGVAVAVVKDNKIIYTKSFGLKNLDKDIPLTNKDIFRIASISKSFSATSIMQLVENGKVSLQDDMSDLLGFTVRNPKYPATVITLKMALSHTSSINDSQGYFDFDVINPTKNPQWEKSYNDYEPGTGYKYCNLNFNMIGAIIERLSGQRFDQYVKSNILKPLGLYGGYWIDELDSNRFVTLYSYNKAMQKFVPAPAAYAPRKEEIKNYVIGYSTPVFSPTGGIKISAQDLAKYMMMHMNKGIYDHKRIISEGSAELMQTVVAIKEGYGLALLTTDDLIPGKTLKGHTGSAYGLYSSMFFQPEEKFGIVIITNGCRIEETDEINPFQKQMINILYNNLIKKAK